VTSLSRVVVAEAGGMQVGLVVDAVSEVIRVPRTAIEPTPALATNRESEHLSGIARVDDELIILLDLERLLAADLAAIDAASIEPRASTDAAQPAEPGEKP
jgi:chemotaxis signal transduction protein